MSHAKMHSIQLLLSLASVFQMFKGKNKPISLKDRSEANTVLVASCTLPWVNN